MTTSALKLLALALMVVDHIGAYLPGTPLWLRYLGRCSAPLFLFCLAWGFHYTHSPKRYLLRLYLGGIATALLDAALQIFVPRETAMMTSNIFPTLLLTGILICLRQRPLSECFFFFLWQCLDLLLLTWLVTQVGLPGCDAYTATVFYNALFPSLIYTEGGVFVVLLGVGFDRLKQNPKALSLGYLFYCLLAVLLTHPLIPKPQWLSQLVRFPDYQWMMVGALPFLLLYNGKRGKTNRLFFYLFYPAHLCVLYLLGRAMENFRI